MQMTTRYLNRRSYIELAMVLAVAIVAASFGRWVIPTGSEQAGDITANASAAVPAWVESRLADLKQAQLDSEDRLDGFGARMTSDTSFEASNAERFAILKQAQLDREDRLDGFGAGVVPDTSFEASNAERLAMFKQAQLDSNDRLDGLTSP